MNILQIAKQAQLEYLKKAISKLNDFNNYPKSTTISFNYSKIINRETITNLACSIPSKGRFIYYFSVADSDRFMKEYLNFTKDRQSNLKLVKLNANDGKGYLYVGSSNSMRKRFKEHCGNAHDMTYALKLSKWISKLSDDIKFTYVEVTGVDQSILQHLEDGLWLKLKPIFGKSGGNNKS